MDPTRSQGKQTARFWLPGVLVCTPPTRGSPSLLGGASGIARFTLLRAILSSNCVNATRRVQGRQAKSKARVSAYEEMAAAIEDAKAKDRFLSGAIVIPPGPRLGEQVLEVRHLNKAIDGRHLLHNVSFKVPRGAIVGVIGGNGTGKTTLLRMISGELQPDAGTVTLGKTVQLGMASQSRLDALDNTRVLEAVCGTSDVVMVGDFEMPARQYLASFNLVGELQTKLVKSLSGGERNRVHLARALKTPSNLLLLDEPTNDLDVDTLRSLEEALDAYTGCAIIVSHDRYFLDRIATHLLIFHGDGKVSWWEGNVSEYIAWTTSAKGAAAGAAPLPTILASDAAEEAAAAKRAGALRGQMSG